MSNSTSAHVTSVTRNRPEPGKRLEAGYRCQACRQVKSAPREKAFQLKITALGVTAGYTRHTSDGESYPYPNGLTPRKKKLDFRLCGDCLHRIYGTLKELMDEAQQ